jgi:hypothetical protein
MSHWTSIFGDNKPIEKTPDPAPAAIPPRPPDEALGAPFGDVAQTATTAIGRRMQTIARDIHERSGGLVGSLAQRNVPGGVMLGIASNAVAAGLERGGKLLESEGIEGVVKGVSDQIKRNPIPFLLVGIGLGYLVGRHSRSSQS